MDLVDLDKDQEIDTTSKLLAAILCFSLMAGLTFIIYKRFVENYLGISKNESIYNLYDDKLLSFGNQDTESHYHKL